ncbi:MAG: LPS export ABC transporter periplasmic protein LptC [Proteobacteria bacterium]|nr:LPS export ABC transporter periplasmic protein LptC [Desulfobacula sp.]MBU4131172.1 LPS export ABC transporter periplasmic protein LptC [Pseudomonadota bacterium]
MNKAGKKKFIYPLLGLLFLILGGIGIFFYVNSLLNAPITIKDINVDSQAALKLNMLKQIFKKNGITELELKASSATLLKKENKAVLKDVNAVFYTKKKTKVYLTSDDAILDTVTHEISFSNNVIVRHQTYTFRTETLHYEEKAHIIRSDTHVTLEDGESFVEGDSMVTDLNLNKTILQGHVKGKFSENFNIP